MNRRPPVSPQRSLLEDAVATVGSAAAARPVETGLSVLAVLAALAGWAVAGPVGGVVLAGFTLVIGGLMLRRPPLAGRRERQSVRRQWAAALRRSGWAEPALPTVTGMSATGAGPLLDVRMPHGTVVADLERLAEPLAAVLEVREVRVARRADNARLARVVIVERDPLAGTEPLRWPLRDAALTSLWEPIPVGTDEDGHPVRVTLTERNVLLGGEPGAGKSAAMSLLIATAALDPHAQLWLLDGKLVELAVWRRCARGGAGIEVGEAIEVLRTLQRDMDDRYAELLDRGRRKVGPDDDLPLHVVVVDELAHYLTCPDRKQRAEVTDLLRDVVSRGRAAGMIVVAATQKPSTDIVPSSLRDLFGFRWALRCSTAQASDTILGSGWASAGYSAASIDAAHRGVGYLLHEGGRPVRLKAAYLDDGAVEAISLRAASARRTSA